MLGTNNQFCSMNTPFQSVSVIPPEILKRGYKAVDIFCKALREGKQKIFPQCKRLVLGEACVGKTSLVRHMTGCEFNPNLDSTCGIENKFIATMVDSAHIDVSTWKTISIGEQAEMNQEHCIKAIAERLMMENPAILEMETKDDPDNVEAELRITETQVLSQIDKLVVNPIRTEPSPCPPPPGKKKRKYNACTEKVSKRCLIQRPIQNFLSNSTSSSVFSQMTPPYTKVSPPPSKRQKTGINNQSLSNPILREKKIPNKGTNTIPDSNTTSNEPQTVPIKVEVQKNRFGRRIVQGVCKKLLTAPQNTQESTLCLEVLDFAGQKEYRPMHHCFMSRRAMYSTCSIFMTPKTK